MIKHVLLERKSLQSDNSLPTFRSDIKLAYIFSIEGKSESSLLRVSSVYSSTPKMDPPKHRQTSTRLHGCRHENFKPQIDLPFAYPYLRHKWYSKYGLSSKHSCL
jgi:hypothetical protein